MGTIATSSVSIPHRYGKNIADILNCFVVYEFPFLIGTVRTQRWLVEEVQTSWFPFLIGTVRTMFVSAFPICCIDVSIPHRYGKNSMVAPSSSIFFLFPFLIGTVRTITLSEWRYGKDKCFHSS